MKGKLGAQGWVRIARGAFWGVGLGLLVQNGKAYDTFVYAVQVSAEVQAAPAQITLTWEPDPFGAESYTVYRKAQAATSWGNPLATLPGSALSYTDTQVSEGAAYEYQLTKAASLGYTGYGYIYAGINAPLIENRGTLLLVVATNATAGLSDEMARLSMDLVGDGWRVLRHDVSSTDTPQQVRALIMNDYYADPANVNALFLLGHVPVFQSGYVAYDGHELRTMAADAYYGEMLNDWPTDVPPAARPTFLPSDVKLMLGRVDLADMPGHDAPTPWPNETELLRNYLNKDHNWRHKKVAVPRRALMANRVGDGGGQACAASGYRNFAPLVGHGNTIEANVQDDAPLEQRWISMVANNRFLWTYACSGGSPNTLGWLGDHGQYHDVWSSDIVSQDAQAVFAMFFGSWIGDWDHTDNLMRAVLATPTLGLASCLAGAPHWFFHHLGLGEPIGYSARLTMNNTSLYRNQINPLTRAVYIALMGDPTLRLDPVAPPSALSGSSSSSGANLSWSASPDSVVGYHVYRATSPDGPFSRLTTALLVGTSFNDMTGCPGAYTYMVRAVKLQTTPSGTYFNPSQGIFTSVNATNSGAAILCQATWSADGVLLTWNTQSGRVYRVQATDRLSQTTWQDLTGPIISDGSRAFWSDTNTSSRPQRFYRVVSP